MFHLVSCCFKCLELVSNAHVVTAESLPGSLLYPGRQERRGLAQRAMHPSPSNLQRAVTRHKTKLTNLNPKILLANGSSLKAVTQGDWGGCQMNDECMLDHFGSFWRNGVRASYSYLYKQNNGQPCWKNSDQESRRHQQRDSSQGSRLTK